MDISLGAWLVKMLKERDMTEKVNLRRREILEKSGSKEDMVN